MNSGPGSRVKRITLSGILLAFTVICVFLAATLPTSKLSLYALSSLFMAVIVIELGTKAGWAFYIASGILSALLVPRLEVIPFIVFFGVYGLIKLYVERIHSRIIEYVLKLAYFNVCLVLGLVFLKEILLNGNLPAAPVYAIAALLEVVFILYDYIYTLFIRFYGSQLKQRLKI